MMTFAVAAIKLSIKIRHLSQFYPKSVVKSGNNGEKIRAFRYNCNNLLQNNGFFYCHGWIFCKTLHSTYKTRTVKPKYFVTMNPSFKTADNSSKV